MARHSRFASASSSSSDGSDSSSDDDELERPRPAQRPTGMGVWILLLLGVCAVVGTALLVVFLQRKDGAGTGATATATLTQDAAASAPAMLSTSAFESPPIVDQEDDGDRPTTTASSPRNRHSSSSASSPGSQPTGSSSSTNSSSSSVGNLPPLVGAQLLVDFSTFSSSSGSASSFLASHNLEISTDPIGSTPISHTFLASNVDIVDGALRLKVTGQSGKGDIKSAEVSTKEKRILYGRVTTRAKASPVPGVWCVGPSLARREEAEEKTDEVTSRRKPRPVFLHERQPRSRYRAAFLLLHQRSRRLCQARFVSGPFVSPFFPHTTDEARRAGLQLTNQALVKGGKSTNTVVPYPSDPTAGFHDVRI